MPRGVFRRHGPYAQREAKAKVRIRRSILSCALFLVLFVPAVFGAEPVFHLNIENNRLPPDKRTLRVTRGDTVTLEVTADRALTLHIHALKIEVKIAPGAATRIAFPARATGRFPVEIHTTGATTGGGHHGPPLAYFEVMPK
jgi:cytochrome c oxidase assembly protein Cox11